MKNLVFALLLTTSLLIERPLLAQPVGVEIDERVRVTQLISGAKIVRSGTALPSARDSVIIAMPRGSFSFALSDLEAIEVHRGQRRNSGVGALAGAVTGGLVLGGQAAAAEVGCDDWICFGVPAAFAIGGAAGVLLGGAAGLVVGSFVVTDRWVKVPLARHTVLATELGVGPNGLTLTFSAHRTGR